MNAGNLIEQLEGMLASKDMCARAEVLRRVTISSSRVRQVHDDQIELFDEVMNKLVETIEQSRPCGVRQPARRGSGTRRSGSSAHWRSTTRSRSRARAGAFRALDDAALVENARTRASAICWPSPDAAFCARR